MTKKASSDAEESGSKNGNGPAIINGSSFPLTRVTRSKEDRHNDWKVRPGYSSGASSYEGSDVDEEEKMALADEHFLSNSRSHILDLVTLREEMKEKGDIASTVVRIEVSQDSV